MDIHAARRLALELMESHGVLGSFQFKFDRSVSRRGATHYQTRFITLSQPLTAVASEHETRLTILHEIAHVLRYKDHISNCPNECNGRHAHDAKWKSILISIGGDGRRTSVRENEIEKPLTIECRNGDFIQPRHKMPKGGLKRYRCPRCRGELFAKKNGQYVYS